MKRFALLRYLKDVRLCCIPTTSNASHADRQSLSRHNRRLGRRYQNRY